MLALFVPALCVFAIVHSVEQVISTDPAPLGQPVVYARKGEAAEDVLQCMQGKAVKLPAVL
jgi:hypothetical protein